jgi:hypothetical protein
MKWLGARTPTSLYTHGHKTKTTVSSQYSLPCSLSPERLANITKVEDTTTRMLSSVVAGGSYMPEKARLLCQGHLFITLEL